MRLSKVKVGATSEGGGMVQRAAYGPTKGAGPRNGPNWPQLFGPQTGPERRSNPQKATGRTRKEGQLLGANNKACLGRGGPVLMGSNLYEDAKCSKAQKQLQKRGETGSLNCGSDISTGQKYFMHSEGDTRREDEGDRSGVKGSKCETRLNIHEEGADKKVCEVIFFSLHTYILSNLVDPFSGTFKPIKKLYGWWFLRLGL